MSKEELLDALTDIDQPGDFSVGGSATLLPPHPGMQVAGVDEPITVPLLPSQASKLIAVSTKALFGSEQDDSKHLAWMVDPSQVHFSIHGGKPLSSNLHNAVRRLLE